MKILSFDVGIINLAYCIFDSDTLKIQYWEIITTPDHTNYSKLYINVITELDKRPFLLDVDVVLIEKQPSFNPKMRIISGCLQTYFFIRGVIDRPEKKIQSVEFFSPKNKLKCYTGPEIIVTGSTKYAQTKKKGILIAEWMLRKNNESDMFKDVFQKSKKKDDLADSYLQAITWCIFKKIMKNTHTDTDIIIEHVVKLTKIEIKKQLKEYLHITEQGDLIDIFNNIPEKLKNGLKIQFPMDLESINKFCSDWCLKTDIKKFNNFLKT
jgi:hypothetical protein